MKSLADTDPALVVETTSGQARGLVDRGVLNWRGIPYGRVVERFRPAVPAQPEARIEATAWGAVSWQVPMSLDPRAWSHLLPGTTESEACLNLNIWAPRPDAPRPVLVWLHPGRHMIGGNMPTADPWIFAARYDVIIVTASYRLGPWGWLHLQTVDPSFDDCVNLGARDQLLLLRWVRDNISQFGGDAGNVTLVGLSTGGCDAAALLGVPAASGLFHKAAIYSGDAEHPVTEADASAFATRFVDAAKALDGSAGDLATAANVALRHVHRQLLRTGGVLYEPVIDGNTFPQPPLDLIDAGLSTDVPVLVSVTSDEARALDILSPRAIDDRYAAVPDANPSASHDEKIEALSRLLFVEPSARLLGAVDRAGGRCWAQVLDYLPTTSILAKNPRSAGRPVHASDGAALFFDVAGTDGNETDRIVCAREQQALISLARDGELPWDRYTAGTLGAQWFGQTSTPGSPLLPLPGFR